MIAQAKRPQSDRHAPSWHAAFIDMLPDIVHFARRLLQTLPPEVREDAIADVVANCTVAYARLVERGKENLAYPTVLAMYAVRRYRDGRRVGKRGNVRDVYDQHAQARGGFQVYHIGCPRDQRHGWREQLTEDRRTPVADQAAFRVDFPDWLRTLPKRDRQIAEQLAEGDRTGEVAAEYGVSPSRVSQMRRALQESWEEFIEDPGECACVATA